MGRVPTLMGREAFPHFPIATLSVQLDPEGRNTLLQGKQRHSSV